MIWLVAAALASAHVPNIASYTLVADGADWRLDVSLPTDGMHRSLGQIYPDSALSDLSVDAYEDVLVTVLRDGVSLRADGVPLALGGAVVSLAPHETRVQFAVDVPVYGLDAVSVHIDALQEGGNQNNVFQLRTETRSERVVLSEANGFEGEIAGYESPSTPVQVSSVSPLAMLGLLVMSFAGLFTMAWPKGSWDA